MYDAKTRKRFFDKVCQPANKKACWFWTGATRGGYGWIYAVRTDGKLERNAHRISWEIHNRKFFPSSLVARHSCDNPPCVNPEHITPGTGSENAMDAVSRNRWTGKSGQRQTTCKRGHLASENTYEHGGRRWCKTCRNIRLKESARRRRAANPNRHREIARAYRARKKANEK